MLDRAGRKCASVLRRVTQQPHGIDICNCEELANDLIFPRELQTGTES